MVGLHTANGEATNIELNSADKREKMKDILILLAVVGIWVLLQAYILPKLGIST
jgi:hypothetical protein